MGILNLMQILKKHSPNSIRFKELNSYKGKKLALDASVSIYQFLISTQSISKNNGFKELTDRKGNLTGHIYGIYSRSLQLMTKGIFPCWVFDGEAPDLKKVTLQKRTERKENAIILKEKALEIGDHQTALKFANQSVKVTKEMINDTKILISSLGLPYVESSSEAEAQCSILAKDNLVYGVVTEDMDCLTFGAPFLLRNVNNKSKFVTEIELDGVLKELGVNSKQFVDLCILCGCDYTTGIEGIGPVRGLKYIKEFQSIENILENLIKTKSKYKFTDEFKYIEARKLFESPNVINSKNIKLIWKSPDFNSMKQFLCNEKGFGISKINKAQLSLDVNKILS